MKIFIGIIFLLSSLSTFAGSIFKDATLGELQVLTTYLTKNFGTKHSLKDVLDDDSLLTKEFKHQGTNYKMIIVYSGDTAHGPVYLPETLSIVGEMSDGDVMINGKYIEIEED